MLYSRDNQAVRSLIECMCVSVWVRVRVIVVVVIVDNEKLALPFLQNGLVT